MMEEQRFTRTYTFLMSNSLGSPHDMNYMISSHKFLVRYALLHLFLFSEVQRLRNDGV